jgi:hypothetical protein
MQTTNEAIPSDIPMELRNRLSRRTNLEEYEINQRPLTETEKLRVA